MGEPSPDEGLERAARFVEEALGRTLSPSEARDPLVVSGALLDAVERGDDPLDGRLVEHFTEASAGLLEGLADEVLQGGCLLLDRTRVVEESVVSALLLASAGARRRELEIWLFALVNDAAQRLRLEEDAASRVPASFRSSARWLRAVAHEVNLLEYSRRALAWRVLVDRRSAREAAEEADVAPAEVERLVAGILERADARARRGGVAEEGDGTRAGEVGDG